MNPVEATPTIQAKTRERSWPLFLFTFVPLFLIYAGTRALSVTGEDSGELITAASELGIAHPPGYPLWILLTHLFIQMFKGESIAAAASLGSALTTALAFATMALVAHRLVRSRLIAGSAAVFAGLGHEIWNHATIAEVYPLNLLILAFVVLFYLRYEEAPSRRRLLPLALSLGFGLANHPTFLWLLPFVALFVALRTPKVALDLRAIALVALGLLLPHLVYLQVYIAASGSPTVSWGVQPTLEGLFDHYTRKAYAVGPTKSPFGFTKAIDQAYAFTRFFIQELTLPGVSAAALGLFFLLKGRRLIGAFVLTLVLATSFGLLPVIPFDVEREELFTARVFLMPCYLLLTIALAAAASKLTSLVHSDYRPRLAAVFLLIPIAAAIARYEAHDRSSYFWAEDYARALLEPLPKDAVVFPGGDTATFPLIYMQRCEDLRPDILILDRSGTLEMDETLSALPEDRREKFRGAGRNELTDAVLNLSDRPVILYRRHTPHPELEITFSPYGLGFVSVQGKLPRDGEDKAVASQGRILEDFIQFRNERTETVSDYTSDVIRSHVEQVRAAHHFKSGNPPMAIEALNASCRYGAGIKETLNNAGALLAENDLPTYAEPYFREAVSIRPDYTLARRNLVLTLRRLDKNDEALEHAEQGLAVDPEDRTLYEIGADAAKVMKDTKALHRICETRIAAVPRDPAPHRLLGHWALEHEKSSIAAENHFATALSKDPHDKESLEALNNVEASLGKPPTVPEASEEAESRARIAALLDSPFDEAIGERRRLTPTPKTTPRESADTFKILGAEDLTKILRAQTAGESALDPLGARLPTIPNLKPEGRLR